MNTLLGIWLYTSLINQGHPVPRPDPSLVMYFNFLNDHSNEIIYYRTGEQGFCRRLAEYHVEINEIVQTVISSDENNADFCGQDTDMQVGSYSRVKYEIEGPILRLYLPMGEDEIVYVWQRSE